MNLEYSNAVEDEGKEQIVIVAEGDDADEDIQEFVVTNSFV